MNKKNLPHIITVVSFVVFIVLGLACGTAPQVKNAASIDELTNLPDKLAWLNTHVESGGNYVLEVNADSSLGTSNGNIMSNMGKNLLGDLVHAEKTPIYDVNFIFKDKSDITITLRGIGGKQTITTYLKDGIFLVGSGVTLILDDNILLKGVPTGSPTDTLTSVVHVNSGGILIMNDGSGIEGNMSFQDGGGVYVANGGTFIMNGGIITGNQCFQPQDQALVMASNGQANALSETPRRGGGVFVDVGGTFTKTGGTITGYASDPQKGNVTKSFNELSVTQNNGHAVFAALGTPATALFSSTVIGSKRKETTAGPDVDLQINSDGTFSGGWDF